MSDQDQPVPEQPAPTCKLDGDDSEHWLKNWWRPAMAIQYIVVCLMDFIGFPIFWAIISPERVWHPLTLEGGGLYHLAMGAIVGVTAWKRTDEKLALYDSNSSSNPRLL